MNLIEKFSRYIERSLIIRPLSVEWETTNSYSSSYGRNNDLAIDTGINSGVSISMTVSPYTLGVNVAEQRLVPAEGEILKIFLGDSVMHIHQKDINNVSFEQPEVSIANNYYEEPVLVSFFAKKVVISYNFFSKGIE